MEMEWTWNPYGMEMESIWNESFHVHSMSIPYGFHSGYGMRKWLGPQPKSFHMDSMEWTCIPYGFHMDCIHSTWIPHGLHPFHMDSMWIPHGIRIHINNARNYYIEY